MAQRTTKHGSTITDTFFLNRDRYHYDFRECIPALGWEQWDTDQDAWYFGIWVNIDQNKILCWAEGDEMVYECGTRERFMLEIADLEAFHGSAPPFARGINDEGITEYYRPRPTDALKENA